MEKKSKETWEEERAGSSEVGGVRAREREVGRVRDGSRWTRKWHGWKQSWSDWRRRNKREKEAEEENRKSSRSSSFDSAMSSSFGAVSDLFRTRLGLEDVAGDEGTSAHGREQHHDGSRKKRKQPLFVPGGRHVLNPMCTTYRAWWFGIAMVALLNSFIVPMEIGFNQQPGLPPYNTATSILQYVMDAIFLLDMVVVFNLATYDERGKPLKNRKEIAKVYLKLYFWIDFLVLFPFDWVALAISGNINDGKSTAAQYTSLLRLLQLLRLYRFGQLQKKLLFYEKLSLEVVILARVVLTFLFLANIFACGFYFIARQGNLEEDSFMSDLLLNFGGLNLFQRYIATFYFAICSVLTTVGYGEMAPVGTAEQAWCMFCILLGISNLAFIQFSLFLLAKSDPKTSKYRDFSEKLATYCSLNSLHDIEPSMQQQLELQYLAAEMSDGVVLHGFPLAVKQKVLEAIYLEFVQRCSLFSGIEQGFMEDFLSRSSVDLFMPGVDLVQKGFVPTHLVILLNGTASRAVGAEVNGNAFVWQPRWGDVDEVKSNNGMEAGTVITEVGFLTRTPQSFSVRACTLCKVLTLSRDAFDELLNIHPGAMRSLLENALMRLKRNIEQLQHETGHDDARDNHSYKETDARFWLPKQRKALDAIRMSINRLGSRLVSEFLDLAFTGDLSGIKTYIAAGMDINRSNYDGRTALMIASSRGFTQVVHALLRAEAEVNAVDARSHSALLEATLFGHDKVIQLLLEYGAELRTPALKQALLLCTATEQGNLALVRRLLEAGVDPNIEDYGERTALHVAISVGNLPAVDILFSHGAKLKAEGRWKDTHLAYVRLMERKVTNYFEAIA